MIVPPILRILLLCLGLLSLTGQAKATEVRVGVYENGPKIFTDAKGVPSGILIDILKAVADRENWQLRYVSCQWDDCLKKLENGDIDLMPDVAYSAEREHRFDFNKTPALYSWSEIYARRTENISSVLDLKNKRIAVLAGGIQEKAISEMLAGFNIKARLVQTQSLEDAFRLTRSGQADAAIASHEYGDQHASEYQLVETPIIFQPVSLYFVTAKGHRPDLLSGIEKNLSVWTKDPNSAYFEILRRWSEHIPDPAIPPLVRESIFAIMGLLLISLLVTILLRKQVKSRTKQLSDSNNQLQATLNAIPDLLFEVDLSGRFYSYHSSRIDLLAKPAATFLGKDLPDVLPASAAEICMSGIREANEHGWSSGKEYGLVLPQGTFWFELSISKMQTLHPEHPHFIVLSRDITQRKAHESQILRLTKLYAALSQCNQAIVRCKDDAELFPIICRDAVNFGGMKMAWIGMVDAHSKQVKPIASFGSGKEYLETLHITTDANEPEGRGPTGRAMRENLPYWCQDFVNDPITAPWHERGKKFGWGASASVPLLCRDTVVGVLTLYAGETNAFDEAARNLLVEMAMDVGFALERFAGEEERKSLEENLHKLSLAVEQSPNSIVITDLNANIEYANATFTKVTGYSLDEVHRQESAHHAIRQNAKIDLRGYVGAFDTRRTVARRIEQPAQGWHGIPRVGPYLAGTAGRWPSDPLPGDQGRHHREKTYRGTHRKIGKFRSAHQPAQPLATQRTLPVRP